MPSRERNLMAHMSETHQLFTGYEYVQPTTPRGLDRHPRQNTYDFEREFESPRTDRQGREAPPIRPVPRNGGLLKYYAQPYKLKSLA
jgi:hypothetical protein